jgi:hypothetical protein
MNPLPTLDQATHQLTDSHGRLAPADLHRLIGTEHPGLYAWFVDGAGAEHLADGIGLPVDGGLIYAGQAGAGTSRATLGSRIRGNHLGGDIYWSTFRLTLASALRERLSLEPTGGRRMNRDGEGRLTAWMREHLAVAVIAYTDRVGLDAFESAVLDRLDPPLNISKRPPTPIRMQLTILRRPFGKRAVTGTTTERSSLEVPHSLPRAGGGLTPEDLARELGLPDAKRVRAFLRAHFPRSASELWSRWGPLPTEMERAVRDRFGRAR